MSQATILATIDTIMAELAGTSDQELGGPAAPGARRNAADVAEYLRHLATDGGTLERHAGKPSSGRVAQRLTEHLGRRFNRQIFFTNVWCGRLLEAFGTWEDGEGASALDDAREKGEAKEPRDRRIAALEDELVSARAENQQLRRELAHLRDFVANTGRMP